MCIGTIAGNERCDILKARKQREWKLQIERKTEWIRLPLRDERPRLVVGA